MRTLESHPATPIVLQHCSISASLHVLINVSLLAGHFSLRLLAHNRISLLNFILNISRLNNDKRQCGTKAVIRPSITLHFILTFFAAATGNAHTALIRASSQKWSRV